eukprot:78855-Chlamydomonas_euryale.AAC.1
MPRPARLKAPLLRRKASPSAWPRNCSAGQQPGSSKRGTVNTCALRGTLRGPKTDGRRGTSPPPSRP